MSTIESPAFWTAIAALVTAVGGVIALFRHTSGHP